LPLVSTTRRTSASGAIVSVSPMIRWNEVPGPISAKGDITSLARNSDFGVTMTSGFLNCRRTCRRSAWK
jgi:hypothetical protein